MVGLVLVSHSKKLAESVRELVLQMTAADFPVAVASGAGESHDELGTDAVHIADVIQSLHRPEGVLVLMDLGSAVLSAQTALELLSLPSGSIQLCAAPFVEGAIAAAVQSFAGASLQQAANESQRGLAGKQQQLEPAVPSAPSGQAPRPSGASAELVLVVKNEHGLHARPAARLVKLASTFTSDIDLFNLTRHRGPAPARSLTSVAMLQVQQGDRIRVVATGEDRQVALQAIHVLAAQDFGAVVGPNRLAAVPGKPEKVWPELSQKRSSGLPGSDGIAIGPLLPLRISKPEVDDGPAAEPAVELASLTEAMAQVRAQMQSPSQTSARQLAVATDVLEAQALLLDDPVVLRNVRLAIEQGASAARSWMRVTEELALQYEQFGDTYLRERAADVRDIAQQVLHNLSGNGAPVAAQLSAPAILLTRELLPSEAAGCDPALVLGVISSGGSQTSHAAILLRTLGIPMVVGVDWLDESTTRGRTVALDGSTGEVWVDPDREVIETLQRKLQLQREQQIKAVAGRSQPSCTLDGTRIQVLANVSSVAEAKAAAANGAEGIGLLRTEFLFLSRADAPGEPEQANALREILAQVRGPVLVRTLDAGADKPLPFLPQTEECNPFLGIRGLRLSLQHEDLFVTHLRAILSAGAGHDLWLMFPMITVVREAQKARELLERAHTELNHIGRSHAWPIKVGGMIEVPSAALMSEQWAEELDFFSIGTNDLTQYVMAAERGNASLAELQDPLHPAVLRLIQRVVDGAAGKNRHVSVCGDAASDPLGAVILAGLGIRSLSARPKQVATIKAGFRSVNMNDLKQLAEEALQSRDAVQVRELAKKCLCVTR